MSWTWRDRMEHVMRVKLSALIPHAKTDSYDVCDRAKRRWTSGSSEWVSQPARSRMKPRTGPSASASTWPTYCSAKGPRRSWRWPGSSTTPDNPAGLRGGAPGVTWSSSARISHSLVSSKNLNSFFFFFFVAHFMFEKKNGEALLHLVSPVNTR